MEVLGLEVREIEEVTGAFETRVIFVAMHSGQILHQGSITDCSAASSKQKASLVNSSSWGEGCPYLTVFLKSAFVCLLRQMGYEVSSVVRRQYQHLRESVERLAQSKTGRCCRQRQNYAPLGGVL